MSKTIAKPTPTEAQEPENTNDTGKVPVDKLMENTEYGIDGINAPSPELIEVSSTIWDANKIMRAMLQNPNITQILGDTPLRTERVVEDRLKPGEYLAERCYALAQQFRQRMKIINAREIEKLNQE